MVELGLARAGTREFRLSHGPGVAAAGNRDPVHLGNCRSVAGIGPQVVVAGRATEVPRCPTPDDFRGAEPIGAPLAAGRRADVDVADGLARLVVEAEHAGAG